MRNKGHELQQLAVIADHYTRWQIAHLLGFLAILVFAAALLGLAFMVRRRDPRLGLVGGTLGVVGLLGLAAAIALDGFTWAELGRVPVGSVVLGDSALPVALHNVQDSAWSWQYYAPALMFGVGLVVLAVAAARARVVPMWSAALLTLGAVLTGTEGVVTSNAYFVAGAAVLLAGSAAVAVSVGRMTDAEFAGLRTDPEPSAERPTGEPVAPSETRGRTAS